MAKSPTSALDIDELARAATGFDYSAYQLDRGMLTAITNSVSSGGAPFYTPTVIPGLVNSTLAIELYFKVILQHTTGTYPQVHYLDELFNTLDSTIRANIKTIYDKAVSRKKSQIPPHLPFAKEALNSFLDLYSILQKMRNAFVDWRYYFEKLPKDRYFHDPIYVRIAARQVFVSIKPEWKNLITRKGMDPNSLEW